MTDQASLKRELPLPPPEASLKIDPSVGSNSPENNSTLTVSAEVTTDDSEGKRCADKVLQERPDKSLEQLNALAAALNNTQDISAEEKQRRMGVIYSRRKRVRQKMRVEVLQEQKNDLTMKNQRLRVENQHLELMLRESLARVAAVERHRVGMWPYGESSELKPTPAEIAHFAATSPYAGGGSMSMMPSLAPMARAPTDMGFYTYTGIPPPASIMPRQDVYAWLQHRGDRATRNHHQLMDQHRFVPLSVPSPQRSYFGWDQTQS